MTEQDLIVEARRHIQEGIDQKLVRVTDWIVTAIVKNHSDVHGADLDFHFICAHGHVRSIVRRVAQEYKETNPVADSQRVLPGFRHFQKGYLVERDGSSVVLSIELMSRDEFLSKAADLRKMAQGCVEHAVEIERYVEDHFPPMEQRG